MRVTFNSEAKAELVDAACFYNRRRSTLGDQFLEEVAMGIENIKQMPTRGMPIRGEIRRILLKRFPYSIIYRIFPASLRILAVKHNSRRPDYWHDRN